MAYRAPHAHATFESMAACPTCGGVRMQRARTRHDHARVIHARDASTCRVSMHAYAQMMTHVDTQAHAMSQIINAGAPTGEGEEGGRTTPNNMRGRGGGCACLRWWIPRLVRGSTVICAPSAPGCGGDLRAGMPEALFFFPKFRLRSVALTSLG